MNTRIHYAYRDGANYKKTDSWTVTGMCSVDQAEAIRNACFKEDDHFYFVPDAVGMPQISNGEWDEDIDHPLCHITDIEMTNQPADDARTMHDLIAAFRARNWEADGIAYTQKMNDC